MRIWTVVGQWPRLAEYWRGDDARFDNRDPNIESFHLLRQALAQRLERPFGSGVGGLGGHGHSAGDRSDVDDASMTPFAHAGDHRLDATEPAEEIRLHDLAKYRQR